MKNLFKKLFCKHDWRPVTISKNAFDFWKNHDNFNCFYFFCDKCEKIEKKSRDGSKYRKKYHFTTFDHLGTTDVLALKLFKFFY